MNDMAFNNEWQARPERSQGATDCACGVLRTQPLDKRARIDTIDVAKKLFLFDGSNSMAPRGGGKWPVVNFHTFLLPIMKKGIWLYSKGNSQPDKILRMLVSIAHQLNTLEFFCSYGQLATYIGIDPNSKLGPKKSCISLENRGIISIKKGTMRMEGIRGKSTTFCLSSKILESN